MRKLDTLAILNGIMSAPSVDIAWKILLEAIQDAGFPRAMYAFTRFRTPNGMGNEDDHLILTNYDSDYLDGFLNEGRYKIAPMAKWALENTGSRSWRWVTENFDSLTAEQIEVVEYNAKHGVMFGHTVGFRPTRSHEAAGIGFSMNPFEGSQDEVDALWEEHGADLKLLCDTAHLKIMSLPLPRKVLTERQKEVLEWVGGGKSIADTATILDLTKATIEKHLRLARDALDVETTAQAVLKASVYNQIYSVS